MPKQNVISVLEKKRKTWKIHLLRKSSALVMLLQNCHLWHRFNVNWVIDPQCTPSIIQMLILRYCVAKERRQLHLLWPFHIVDSILSATTECYLDLVDAGEISKSDTKLWKAQSYLSNNAFRNNRDAGIILAGKAGMCFAKAFTQKWSNVTDAEWFPEQITSSKLAFAFHFCCNGWKHALLWIHTDQFIVHASYFQFLFSI